MDVSPRVTSGAKSEGTSCLIFNEEFPVPDEGSPAVSKCRLSVKQLLKQYNEVRCLAIQKAPITVKVTKSARVSSSIFMPSVPAWASTGQSQTGIASSSSYLCVY